MVHNNKILTVSYGTFSCTLEGFDDSFGTMKAIAEYFRDLAADDRYFGAEPPVPDAEMLARIAQREVSRKVEAHEDDGGGIVLRAQDLVGATAAIPAVAATVDTAEAEDTAEELEQIPETAVAEEEPIAEAAEQVVEEELVAEAAEEVKQADAGQTEVVVDEDIAEEEPFNLDAGDVPHSLADVMAQTEVAPEVEVEQVAEAMPEAAPIEPDSIAAKLQRIRAVVSRNEASEEVSEYTEDEHAEAFVSDAASELTEALEEDDARMSAEEPVEEDELADVLARLDQSFEPEADDVDDISDDLAQVDDGLLAAFADEDDADDLIAEASDTDDGDDVLGRDNLDDDSDDYEDDDALFADLEDTDLEPAEVDEVANILDTSDEPEATEVRRPSVVKVDRADFEAAIASGDMDEISEDIDQPEGSLSSEDEDDLMRELAELEAEVDSLDQEPEAIVQDSDDWDGDADFDDFDDLAEELPEDHAEVAEAKSFQPIMPADSDGNEEDLSRLMEAAGEKMGEAEVSTSRETYNQLRAAVAATEADRSAGGELGDTSGDDAYREDLASVVRPRRPVASSDRPERPAVETRPAPLKLVAEQRVDADAEAAPRGPVRPRRVAAKIEETNVAATEVDGTFEEFAAEMGATQLPEILEAAAAYLSFVEGHDQFSRPQLMTKVRQVETSGFNREDGLRSFGMLLRQGKIEKTGGGRFTVSNNIGFRPDERAVG